MKKIVIKYIGVAIILIGIAIPIFKVGKKEILEINEMKELEEKIANDTYFALLEIPKINLKKELFSILDEQNDVDKNVYLHPKSTFPDQKTSNIILAGHSGYGASAHFQNLYQLRTGDEVIIYYQNVIYKYEIREIEVQKKNGTLYLKKENDHMITLITCTKNDGFSQTIYYGMLKNGQK